LGTISAFAYKHRETKKSLTDKIVIKTVTGKDFQIGAMENPNTGKYGNPVK
jgi:hypothetical protein